MSRKRMDGEEKVRILVLTQENVIIRCTERARSSVMTLLAAAPDLPQDVTHATKTRSGRPPKTYKQLQTH